MSYAAVVPYNWSPVDPDADCRDWTALPTGETVRMTSRATALQQLQTALNHVLGFSPRVTFCKFVHEAGLHAEGDEAGAVPYNYQLNWTWPDSVENGTSRAFRWVYPLRLADPQIGGGGAQFYPQIYSGGAWGITPGAVGAILWGTAPTQSPDTYVLDELHIVRGSTPSDAEVLEGCFLADNFQLASLVVQDDQLTQLEATDLFCPAPPRTGQPIVGGSWLEQARAALHDHRATNLPIVANWVAWGQISIGGSMPEYDASLAADTAQPNGVRIDSTSFLNILDVASTAHSASTPGWLINSYARGVGVLGSSIRHTVRVLARAVTTDATVRFSTAAGDTDITITAGGSVAWAGTDSDYVTTDSSLADGNTDNKLDVLGKAGAGGELWIYGIRAWTIWG